MARGRRRKCKCYRRLCVPDLRILRHREGSIIGQSRGVSALDGRAERAVALAVLGNPARRAVAAVHVHTVGFGPKLSWC
jgi:hypothetical protein